MLISGRAVNDHPEENFDEDEEGEMTEFIYDDEDFEDPSYVEDEDIYAYTDDKLDGDIEVSNFEAEDTAEALYDDEVHGFDPQGKSNKTTFAVLILLALLGFGGFYLLYSGSEPDRLAQNNFVPTVDEVESPDTVLSEGTIVPDFTNTDLEELQENPVISEESSLDDFITTDDDTSNSASIPTVDNNAELMEVSRSQSDQMNFDLPQPQVNGENFDFSVVEIANEESVPEEKLVSLEDLPKEIVDSPDELAENDFPQGVNFVEDDIVVEVLNTPQEILEFFDAEDDGSDKFTSLGSFARQNEVVSNPRREEMAKFIVVENRVETDTHSNELVMAQRALNLGRYDAALDFYQKLYSKNQRDPRILLGRAVALQKTGRFAEALQAYEVMLDLYPSNSDALVNYLGLMNSKYPQDALGKLERLHRNNPNNPAVAAQLGISYGNVGEYEKAKTFLKMATNREPKNSIHFYNLAIISERAGDRISAVKAYEKALEVDAVYGGNAINREVIYDRLSLLR